MKALKEVGHFSGEGDVERWIARFEMAVVIDGEERHEPQQLAMRLDGAAYDTWSSLKAEERSSAGAIKAALRKAYGMSRADAWSAAMHTTLLPGEPLDAVCEQVKKNLRVALAGGDPLDSACALIMMSTLPQDVGDKVRMHLGSNVTTAGVLETAKAIMPTAAPHAAAVVPVIRKDSHVAAQASSRRLAAVPGKKPAPRRCYICDEEGHLMRDCPTRERQTVARQGNANTGQYPA